MNIFNSLGSNYSAGFVWHALLKPSSKAKTAQLIATLGDYYQGRAQLTYKGRQALEIAVKRAGLPAHSAVAINGLTCYVVYQAVKNAGHQPVMVDVAPGALDFGVKQLQATHKNHPNLGAVIIQNTLGFPVDMVEIEKYCRRHKLVIIEDLAHSVGTMYQDGREAGTVGDLVMLSFSQDKPLDVVAGGACIDRRPGSAIYQPLAGMNLWQRFINRTYPFWTALIRSTYPLALGRFLHAGLKKLRLLATPMSDNIRGLYGMTAMGCALLPDLWAHKTSTLKHRRRIAAVYHKNLPADIQYQPGPGETAYLRFPIRVADRKSLVAHLKRQGVYIGDTWYDAPIAPGRYMADTDYQMGQCPEADKLAAEIVNLPTHRHVSEEAARAIAEKVKKWLKST